MNSGLSPKMYGKLARLINNLKINVFILSLKGHSVELVGTTEVDGSDTYEIKLTKESGEVKHYYHKLIGETMRVVWNQLNPRLLKWVEREKGLYKMASVRWLKQQYKTTPDLFEPWKLVHPLVY